MVSPLFLAFYFVSLLVLRRVRLVFIPKQILHLLLADGLIQPLPSLLRLVLAGAQQKRCQYHDRRQ